MTHKRTVFTFITVLLLMLWGQTSIHAQDEQPAPEFLYRDGNHLVLVNGYTGETSTLPLEVTERDRFEWSPDGRYLLAHLYDVENEGYCLNLYDMDQQKWRHDKPISCAAQFTIFDDDGSHIYYTTNDKTNSKLWVYSLTDNSSRKLYETTSGDNINPAGISELIWSPTRQYLTFVSYKQIMGGTLNFFVAFDTQTEKSASISALDPYYASYSPVWSADDRWFLLSLSEQYVTSGTLPFSNYENDVYLANTETGEVYRLTYTPTVAKWDIHWTDEGEIAFSEVRVQQLSYTLEQAMNIEVVPHDKIVTPEPVNVDDYLYDPSADLEIAPDPNIAAKFIESTVEGKQVYEIRIFHWNEMNPSIDFSISISNPNTFGTVLIGWRPSDYPYSGG